MLGGYVPVRAEVVNLGVFSVHADQQELINWLDTAEQTPEVVYLVHGEPDSSSALHDVIERREGWTAVVARDRERVRLD